MASKAHHIFSCAGKQQESCYICSVCLIKLATLLRASQKTPPFVASCSKFDFEWPVNLAVAGPCGGGGPGGGSLVAMVGDFPESCVVDLRSNARVATLSGHLDFTFAASWHPDQPHTLATGNQARP